MNERNKSISELYKTGKTLQEIGEQYGITRERVRQILRAAGVSRTDGGVSLKSKSRLEAAQVKRLQELDIRSFESYGCSHEERVLISGGKCSEGISAKYMNQRNSSISRGIEWAITFPEWIEAWEKSGLLDSRGLSSESYTLSRKDFKLGFTKENVVVEQLSKLGSRTRNYYKKSERS